MPALPVADGAERLGQRGGQLGRATGSGRHVAADGRERQAKQCHGEDVKQTQAAAGAAGKRKKGCWRVHAGKVPATLTAVGSGSPLHWRSSCKPRHTPAMQASRLHGLALWGSCRHASIIHQAQR